MSLQVSDIIKIQTSISPTGLVRRETGRTLFLTRDTTIPQTELVRVYSNFSGVKADFAEGSEPYNAGEIYFSQQPMPKNFLVGRIIDSATAEEFSTITSAIGIDLTELVLVGDGFLSILVQKIVGDVTSYDTIANSSVMDFTGSSTVQDIATVISSHPDFSDFNVIVDGDKIKLEAVLLSGETSRNIIDVTGVGTSGTNIDGMLRMNSAYHPPKTPYIPASSGNVKDGLDKIKAANASFTFVCEESAMVDTQDVIDISEWCKAERVYIHACYSNDPNCKSNLGFPMTKFGTIRDQENDNSFGTYSEYADYKHVSIASRLSSVNFRANNSLINAMFKTLPMTAPDDLSFTEADSMHKHRVNFYSRRSGIAMYEEGKTFNPNYWIDTKYWLIWFENACLTALFNVLYRSKKVPQTSGGVALLETALRSVCDEGVRNGGIAPNKVSAETTADIQQTTGGDFDGYLTTGYLVYGEPIESQSQDVRNTRIAPPIHIWLKGAGAINGIELSVLFEQ
jgi:hypothetical protein